MAFASISAFAQFPNILASRGQRLNLFSSANGGVELGLNAFTDVMTPGSIGFRDPNLASSITNDYMVVSSNDTIYPSNSLIASAHESEGLVFIATTDGMMHIYDKPLLNETDAFPFPFGVVESMILSFTNEDSIMAAMVGDDIYLLSFTNESFALIRNQAVDSFWFTHLQPEELISNVALPSDNNPFELDTFIYSDPWYVRVTGDLISESLKIFSSDWMFSMDDDSLGFQSNFFDGMIGYPRVVSRESDVNRVASAVFSTHADISSSQNRMGSGYVFSINPEKGITEPLAMAWQGDDFNSDFNVRTLAFIDNPVRLYRTRTNGIAQVLDPNNLVPIGEIPRHSVRQVELTGPNDEWVIRETGFDMIASDGSLYEFSLPVIKDFNDQSIFEINPSDLNGFTLDGENCGYESFGDFGIYKDIAHPNGADFSAKDGSWTYLLGVDSWRNGRVDTIINGEIVPISFGLMFYMVNRTANRTYFLKELSRDLNYEMDLMTQHHPKFINSEFDDNGNNWLTFWHNNMEECTSEYGEAVTIKLTWVDSLTFNYEFIKKPIGPSHALGSNYVKIIHGDTLGLGNTSTHDFKGTLTQRVQAAFYETSRFMPKQTIASIEIFDNNEFYGDGGPLTYQMDFTAKSDFSIIPSAVTWQLNADSTVVTLEIEQTPEGIWYWNGSEISADSVLTYPVEYILQKESAWFYFSGNSPLDIAQDDWINRMVSTDPINLKEELMEVFNNHVGISEVQPKSSFIIFPNPSSNGKFTLANTEGKSLGTITIVNSIGQIIKSEYSLRDRLMIDLERGFTIAKTSTTTNGVVIMIN